MSNKIVVQMTVEKIFTGIYVVVQFYPPFKLYFPLL